LAAFEENQSGAGLENVFHDIYHALNLDLKVGQGGSLVVADVAVTDLDNNFY
jgi:hypothetical protein